MLQGKVRSLFLIPCLFEKLRVLGILGLLSQLTEVTLSSLVHVPVMDAWDLLCKTNCRIQHSTMELGQLYQEMQASILQAEMFSNKKR